jgi:hypothetical protein
MLFGAFMFWNKTRGFLARAHQASGTVVELLEVRDNEGSSKWKPVVAFTDDKGHKTRFTDSVSSRPAAYDVGEAVTVLYLPGEPGEAHIKGFSSLWLGTTILGGLGVIFAGIGAGIVFATHAGEKKKHYLLAYGNAVETEVQGVDRNTSVEINGQNPWRISSQWLDPKTNVIRIFHSENLWFDPSSYMKRKKVMVLLDPNNPKRYYMDISFLPEIER